MTFQHFLPVCGMVNGVFVRKAELDSSCGVCRIDDIRFLLVSDAVKTGAEFI